MKANDIINIMNKWAKPELIDSWDNTGFQIGNKDKDISKILISLDLDRIVLDKAICEDYDMIITHHPLIFKPLSEITYHTYKGKLIMDLIKNDIVAFNAHSNLDLAHNGVNYTLAGLLGITNTLPLSKVNNDTYYGYGRVGQIQDTSILDLVELIKKQLNADNLIVYGNTHRTISKIAVCGGSGRDFITHAYKLGAEAYITGDITYHDGQLAHELGLTLIDAGHYNTEKIILPIIKEYLNNNLQDKVEIDLVNSSSVPYQII